MKDQVFLSISAKEFIECIAKIGEKDLHLKVIKKEERKLVLLFSTFFPLAFFSFTVLLEDKDQIKVRKKINYSPLMLVSTFLLVLLESVLFLSLLFFSKQNIVSYLLVSIGWIFVNAYFVFQILDKFDKIIGRAFNVS